MNSKERVISALSHRQPDRTPRFIWLGDGVYERLTARFGITPLELELRLGNDILQTWLSINREMERKVPDQTAFVDEWGIAWKRDGHYNMVTAHPLSGMDAAAIAAHPFPDPAAEDRYAGLRALLDSHGGSHFIGADVSGTLFEPACHLRGMEELMMDLYDENREGALLLDRLEAFSTAVALEAVRMGADWIWLGDDLGSQNSMMLSPDMWRAVFKPRMKRIIAAIRAARPDMPVAYHSCGSMSPVIGDLAEIGVSALNPVQESAAGMDQRRVKAEFGDRLSLVCGPDTQTFLVHASPQEVEAATRGLAESLGRNGGYIFAVSHHIQHDTPDENIDAMLRALDGRGLAD
jgi:uroporphyrinogen decarboxylase